METKDEKGEKEKGKRKRSRGIPTPVFLFLIFFFCDCRWGDFNLDFCVFFCEPCDRHKQLFVGGSSRYKSFFAMTHRIRSAIRAINSEFVGLYSLENASMPRKLFMTSALPLLHAISIACRMARSTMLADALYVSPICGYKSFVTEPI